MNINFDNIPEEFLEKIEKIKIADNFKPMTAFYIEDGIKQQMIFMAGTVYIERRRENPNKYAILYHGNCMNKEGEFSCEYRPSERSEEYLREFRFDSIKEAYDCFKKNHILYDKTE